jgi:putative addiction module component (TIGR02574 family)
MTTQVTDILELSVAERLRIVEDIWESIVADSGQLEISDDLRVELDRRLAMYEEDPREGVLWGELQDRLSKSR